MYMLGATIHTVYTYTFPTLNNSQNFEFLDNLQGLNMEEV